MFLVSQTCILTSCRNMMWFMVVSQELGGWKSDSSVDMVVKCVRLIYRSIIEGNLKLVLTRQFRRFCSEQGKKYTEFLTHWQMVFSVDTQSWRHSGEDFFIFFRVTQPWATHHFKKNGGFQSWREKIYWFQEFWEVTSLATHDMAMRQNPGTLGTLK